MQPQPLTLALLQTDILWEDISGNLSRLRPTVEALAGRADIVVLPEMFTTGFSMDAIRHAEPVDGPTLCALRRWATETGLAFCGSFICRDADGRHVNRAFFVTPESEAFFYDKRHLFRLGDEQRHFHPGSERRIVGYKGWRISLMICYDLRFPVWCRNRHNDYDLQIFVANWPASRQMVWQTLLRARALENCAYVAGVNRIGIDGMGLTYRGGTQAIDMKGKTLAEATDGDEAIVIATLDHEALTAFRAKFPVWMDADEFSIE